MSNICKTVTLRTRKIKGGEQLSFYLDYYPGYRDESTMKVMRHESLGIYIYAKPKNQREKDYNERMCEKAEALRCRRYESIVNERSPRRFRSIVAAIHSVLYKWMLVRASILSSTCWVIRTSQPRKSMRTWRTRANASR